MPNIVRDGRSTAVLVSAVSIVLFLVGLGIWLWVIADDESLGDTIFDSTVVVAPRGGETISQIPVDDLPAGAYRLSIWASVSGVAAADLNNIRLNKNATAFVEVVPHGVNGASGDGPFVIPRVTFTGREEAGLATFAIAAGSPGVEYHVTLLAERID